MAEKKKGIVINPVTRLEGHAKIDHQPLRKVGEMSGLSTALTY